MDGVSQRAPGSGRGMPRNSGAAVEKQSRRRASWKERPGLLTEVAGALLTGAWGAASSSCTEQGGRGFSSDGSAAGRWVEVGGMA